MTDSLRWHAARHLSASGSLPEALRYFAVTVVAGDRAAVTLFVRVLK